MGVSKSHSKTHHFHPVENHLFIRALHWGRQLTRKRSTSLLIHGGGGLQVYRLPLTLNNALSNLCNRLAFVMHCVTVVRLFQAGGTLSSVSAFETTVQAVVSHAVTIAIARLLMQHRRDPGREFVGVCLIGELRIFSPQLFFGKNGRQLGSLGWRSRIIGWDLRLILRTDHCAVVAIVIRKSDDRINPRLNIPQSPRLGYCNLNWLGLAVVARHHTDSPGRGGQPAADIIVSVYYEG